MLVPNQETHEEKFKISKFDSKRKETGFKIIAMISDAKT